MSDNQIAKKLTTREICREKLSVFYGSRDNYTHGFREVCNNGIDEINENFEEGTIEIIMDTDNKTITVKDSGRGMPLFKKDNYKLILEETFAGTKYEEGIYTTGTNGTGLAVLNYTSEYFKIKSYHDDVVEEVEYRNGGQLVDKKVMENASLHGTTCIFRLDDDVYTKVVYDKNEIIECIKMFSIVSNKIKFMFYYGDEKLEFHYNSIEEFFKEEKHTCSVIVGEEDITKTETKVEIDKTRDEEHIIPGETDKVIGVISTQVEPIQYTFLNGNFLKENGAIYDGAIGGAKKFFNDTFNKKYSDKDIRESLGFVIDFRSSLVEYANQTKFSTNKALYRKVTNEYVLGLLQLENARNPENIKKMVAHIDKVNKANSNSDKARQKLQKELTKGIEGIGNKPAKFKGCKAKGMDAELFITEGDSALTGFVEARDSKFQAGFPIRGKFINVLKANKNKVLSNEEVKALGKLIGIGLGDDLDLSNINFGKIIMLVDADPDGFAICCLLLNFFWKYIPQLLTEGLIYKAESPLFEIRDKNDKMYYAYSDEERDKILAELGKGCMVSRLKGIGETDSEVLAETALHPETRRLTQFKVDNPKGFDKKMMDWFGKTADARKELILEAELNMEEM